MVMESVRLLAASSLVVALAACGTSPEPTPSSHRASAEPTVTQGALPPVECDSSQFTPLPILTCDEAVAAALERVVLTASPLAIRFHYGDYCVPGQFCPATRPDRGFVVIEFAGGQGPDLYVPITFDDIGGQRGAVAGTPATYPPE
jgi:hypothetical protein